MLGDDEEVTLPSEVLMVGVGVNDLDDGELLMLLGELVMLPEELLIISPGVSLTPSAFASTLLIRSSSSFWSGSPRLGPLLVATTSNLPSAAETCISFFWLSSERVLIVPNVSFAFVLASNSSLETS
ncbi:hypothetical protein StoSoilA2_34680 [Arthrobacter sp. StoSoilA2]|nr:hypothetical protein StoSoilA2_34680 [Arthrobacter sp. StoSoilA2]